MASDFNPQFQKIGEILIHAGKIDESQLNSALAEQKKTNEKIGQTLISAGFVDEEDFITANTEFDLAKSSGIKPTAS